MIYNLNKPVGILSADFIRYHQQKVGARKAGHGGALDALASGELVMATDRDTKQLQTYLHKTKTYRCTMVLGIATDTADLEATKVTVDKTFLKKVPADLTERVTTALFNWVGTHDQHVPLFSSVKVQGYTLREIARFGTVHEVKEGIVKATYRGKELLLELPAKPITVIETKVTKSRTLNHASLMKELGEIEYELSNNISRFDQWWLQGKKSKVYGDIQKTVAQVCAEIDQSTIGIDSIPVITWEAQVSGGTYIRQLAVDLAAACGTIGCCLQIHRLTVTS